MPEFTRDEVVTMAMAVEEFRSEFSGPHIDDNRDLSHRIQAVLREAGNRFEIRPLPDGDD